MRFDGRSVVLTGAASGIGQAAATLLAAQGAAVTLADVNISGITGTAQAINDTGGQAHAVETDVSEPESVRALMRAAERATGGVDTVINVAGIQRSASIEDVDPQIWDRQFAVNVRSVFLTAKYAVPLMRKNGSGVFLSVASIAALKGIPGLTAYSASKGAIVSFSRTLATEVAQYGIRVACVCPGWVDTPFNDPVVSFMGGKEAHESMVTQEVPLGRQGKPPEIANFLAFLASDEAAYFTGQAVVVDGGITA